MTLTLEVAKESEKYGVEINELIHLTGELPIRKKKLVVSLQKHADEMEEFEGANVQNDYEKAVEFIQKIDENEVEEVCYYIADLYKGIAY